MSRSLIEDSPFTSFHRKLTLFSSGGPFLDGYMLSIIGIALVQLGPKLHLNAFWNGMIGASSLAGIFIGGLLFGYITDLIGRKVMYTIDLAIFLVVSILQMFVHSPMELFILRLILGIAIGADYPIATSLLAEFAPRKHRAMMMGFLLVVWYIGATLAYVVGYLLLKTGPNAWMWMLGSSAVPALFITLMRSGTPESPRWLISKGRVDEARAIVKKIYGPKADIDDLSEEVEETRIGKIMHPEYVKRTWFIGLFWMFQIVPEFAIYTFGPQILNAFHLGDGDLAYIGSAVISAFFLIGCAISLFLVYKVGRRPLVIWTFVLMTLGLLVLGVFPKASLWVIVAGFALYAIFCGAQTTLDWLYPTELFPTEIRATAVGLATAISRIGATVGTFVLPYSLSGLGIGNTMLIMTGLTFLGVIISVAWAPETMGLTLKEASSITKQKSKVSTIDKNERAF